MKWMIWNRNEFKFKQCLKLQLYFTVMIILFSKYRIFNLRATFNRKSYSTKSNFLNLPSPATNFWFFKLKKCYVLVTFRFGFVFCCVTWGIRWELSMLQHDASKKFNGQDHSSHNSLRIVSTPLKYVLNKHITVHVSWSRWSQFLNFLHIKFYNGKYLPLLLCI